MADATFVAVNKTDSPLTFGGTLPGAKKDDPSRAVKFRIGPHETVTNAPAWVKDHGGWKAKLDAGDVGAP